MKKAKCYIQIGWWRYYRTEDGETYAIRDQKYYFYCGNVKTDKSTEIKYLTRSEVEELKKRVEFVQ